LTVDLRKVAKAFWDDEYLATRLYRYMAERRTEKAEVFDQLSTMESRHGSLWEKLYAENSGGARPRASGWLKFKLNLSKVFMRIVGYPTFVRYMELSESQAIRTYGTMLDDPELEGYHEDLRAVVLDEVQHEVTLLSEVVKLRSNIDDVRNAVYGMVDALVEVLAVVVGLAVALVNPAIVALGGIISASAGTLSMSAGAYLSSKSQRDLMEGKMAEVSVRSRVVPEEQAGKIGKRLKEWGMPESVVAEVASEIVKNRNLAEAMGNAIDLGTTEENLEDPVKAAKSAGIYYFMGALAPVAPFLAMVGGQLGIGLAVILSLLLLSIASAIIAMLSGVSPKRKVLEMDLVALMAAAATFAIGYVARTILGLAL
jgi:VIT1/CCC1 family predicted Fe2+/Mn2+ transporter